MAHPSLPTYNTLHAHMRARFGKRVQKIPLDAGFTCPNRDGTISRRGCTFCNPEGSGTGLLIQGFDLARQWDYWREQFIEKRKNIAFLAYLQSYTNTHGPLERIRSVLDELKGLPDLIGLSMGTRPDCLDPAKLDLIAGFPAPEIQLEMGLQSCNDETLRRINRGHDAACFAAACREAARRGIKVVAHLMAGLPGETMSDFLASVDFVSSLPVHGVKFHNLYICKNTEMAAQLQSGAYAPPSLDEYAETVARALARLRPDIIVHRLNADPGIEEHLAPDWVLDKPLTLDRINSKIKQLKITQGCEYSTFGSL